MALRPVASPAAFVLGCLLLGGAAAMLVAARVLPAEGLQDLGRIVGAMMLAGASALPFAFSIALAPRGRLPRPMLAIATLGCLLALAPGIAFVSTGTPGGLLMGALIVAASVGGLAASARRWRRSGA